MLRYPDAAILKEASDADAVYHGLADWLEASAVFGGEVSKTDALDMIEENELDADQDDINLHVSNAWAELRRRESLAQGGAGIELSEQWVEPSRSDWENMLGYAFCVFVSLAELYSNWGELVGPNYQEQGGVFEELVEESLHAWEWETVRTGWQPGNTDTVEEVVDTVTTRINEPIGKLQPYTTNTAKDEGLDIVCWRPFQDGWTGKPLYLFQCASGKNWTDKVKQPDMEVWTKLIDFGSNACRGFATPYALTEAGFRRYSTRCAGLFLDRYRILSPPGVPGLEISDDTEERLSGYLQGRVDQLPRA